MTTITKRLSWRTKRTQFYQSAGCGQVHNIEFIGACECCGRSVYSHGCQGAKPCGDTLADSPDPRGVIPSQHCMNLYHAKENGMVGRDVITCAACAEDGDKYRSILAAAKSTGTWTAPTLSKCDECGGQLQQHEFSIGRHAWDCTQQNCDGSGPHTPGEVRVMPTGGDGNLILCRSCWMRENEYRRQRNQTLGKFAQFDRPTWDSGKVYES